MIQAVVLHGCITRPLTVREKHIYVCNTLLCYFGHCNKTRSDTQTHHHYRTVSVQCLADRTKLERGKEHTLLATTPANQ